MKQKEIIKVLDLLIEKQITYDEAKHKLFVLYGVVEPRGKLKCVDSKHYKSLTKGKYYQRYKNPNGINLPENNRITVVDDKGNPQRFLKGCFQAF